MLSHWLMFSICSVASLYYSLAGNVQFGPHREHRMLSAVGFPRNSPQAILAECFDRSQATLFRLIRTSTAAYAVSTKVATTPLWVLSPEIHPNKVCSPKTVEIIENNASYASRGVKPSVSKSCTPYRTLTQLMVLQARDV